ncbi:hypothetical protein WA158_003855 [Blastocystis sp. Blastoise]
MSWRAALGKNLQEVRFLICPKSVGSKGVVEYIYKNYGEMKMLNPILPFLVREAEGVKACVIGRYDFGEERIVNLENSSPIYVYLFIFDKSLHKLADIGATLPRSQESDLLGYRPPSII